ncbi:MAG TPA: hypothetical protein VME40_19635 [Caulobacteraceae bacterium]|nr:hypothetical protein [Caulobacteraceae bacterium]
MRKLDWFLAAVVVSFLIGTVVVEAAGGAIAGLALNPDRPFAATDISVRRLIGHLPNPLLPGDPR